MYSESHKALFAFVVIVALCNSTFASNNPELLIPANTKVSIELLSPISTATGKKGDKFTCKVLTPAEYSGAIVEGHIRNVKRSGKANKDSKIDLAFDRIVLVDGRLADFNATVVEVFDVPSIGDQGRADNEGLIRNKSTTVKTSIKRAAIGALIGAVVGGVVAGGQGAAVGAAIGAGLGVTTTLATRGPDLEFKAGTQFTVVTNGPVNRRELKAGEAEVARPVLQPVQPTVTTTIAAPAAYTSPPPPSTSLRELVTSEFSVSVPDNWIQYSKEPFVVSPEGGYKLTNGRPEVSYGAMFGALNVGTRDLKQGSDRFVEAMIKSNSDMYRRVSSASSSLGVRSAIATTLSGKGTHGRMESVTIHTTIQNNGALFYLITVVSEEESALYTDAFNALVRTLQIHK
jgi:hypothetical protein